MAQVNRPPTKPNLLFIFTDQQRFDTMRCYGNHLIQTPNLNALANDSFVFQNAYVTQPLCTPARSSIMTGLYPHTNGCIHLNIPLKPSTPTIAEMVPSEYECGYIGKWHLGDEIFPQHGFGHWVGMEDYYRLFFTKREYLSRFSDYHHFLLEHGYTPDVEWMAARIFSREMTADLPWEMSKNAYVGREAARFIRENGERPFVLYAGFMDPHSPLPSRPSSLYDPAKLPREPHFLRRPPANASLYHQKKAEFYGDLPEIDGEDLGDEAGWLRLRARYWEAISGVDRAMAPILEALSESGVADNTIVVYTSDHGEMMGSHGMLHKEVLYQESIKVPLLMRVPWITDESRQIAGHTSQIDLVPTLLGLMGVPLPSRLEGKSLEPVLRGETSLEENAVFIETNGPLIRAGAGVPWPSWQPWRTVISGDGWKLNLSTVDQCELYDLNEDPTEENNLYDDAGQKDRISSMTTLLQQWQQETDDDALLPEV